MLDTAFLPRNDHCLLSPSANYEANLWSSQLDCKMASFDVAVEAAKLGKLGIRRRKDPIDQELARGSLSS